MEETTRIGTQVGLNEKNHYDDIFVRTVFIALLNTLSERCKWVYRFDDKDREFTLPFLPSFVGQDRFLNNLFLDDIPERRVELNRDVVPRCVVTYKNLSIKPENYTNPHIRINHITEKEGKKIQVTSKSKAIPVSINFSLEAKFNNASDMLIFTQEMVKIFWAANFFNFDYSGVRLDAFFSYPDLQDISNKNKEIKIETLENYTATTELTVETFMPILTDTKTINRGKMRVMDISIYDLSNKGNTKVS